MQGLLLTFFSATKMLETWHRGLNFDLSPVYTDQSQPQSCENFFPSWMQSCADSYKSTGSDNRNLTFGSEFVLDSRFGCVDDDEKAEVQRDKRPQIKTECKSVTGPWSHDLSNGAWLTADELIVSDLPSKHWWPVAASAFPAVAGKLSEKVLMAHHLNWWPTMWKARLQAT